MKELIVSNSDAGGRFDKYLLRLLPNASKSFIYKMLRKKNITLNGKKAEGNEKLIQGDMIRVFFSDETYEKMSGGEESKTSGDSGFVPCKADDISVVYEDDMMLILDKPAGILSQKSKNDDISLNDEVLSYLYEKGEYSALAAGYTPSIVNRLDRNTSGLIIAAKTYNAAVSLSKMLKDRECHKYYRCVVDGIITESALLEGYLKKDAATNTVSVYDEPHDDARHILTAINPISTKDDHTYLEVELLTGRTHQIRAHLAHIGHPVTGDRKYGSNAKNAVRGAHSLYLHSYRLVLPAKREFTAKLPDRFKEFTD